MEYVFDFMRLLGGDRAGGGRASGARRRGGVSIALQLRLVFYGVLLGLMMPVIRQIDWSALVPPGVRIDWPSGFGIAWPAGGLHVPGGWGRAKDVAVAAAPSVSGITAGAAAAGAAAAGAAGRAVAAGGGASNGDGIGGAGLGGEDLGGNGKAVTARFTICGHGKRITCMVDGDTFWLRGTKVRIADIDTPETHPPRCKAEARAGKAATLKMQAMLNAGPFTLVPIKRDVDRYGRKLRIVERDGVSLGAALVRHGLARHYGGGKRSPWC